MGYLTAVIIGQASIVAFMLWPTFRIARKVGFSPAKAWLLIGACFVCSAIGSGANVLVAQQGWLTVIDFTSTGGLAAMALLHFALSPFTLSAIPVLYFSFREWPLETRAKEPNVFG